MPQREPLCANEEVRRAGLRVADVLCSRMIPHVSPHVLDRVPEATLGRSLTENRREIFEECRVRAGVAHARDGSTERLVGPGTASHDGILVLCPQFLRVSRQGNAPFLFPDVFLPQQDHLCFRRSHKRPRPSRAGDVAHERCSIGVPAQAHLGDKLPMANGQATHRGCPATCLRVSGVPCRPVHQEDRVNAVQFAMLAEQAPAIQIACGKIPDSHRYGPG